MPDIGTGVTAGVSLFGASKQAKAASQAADASVQAAQIAAESAMPWDVGGMFGEAVFDEEGKRLDMTLSEPWQAEYDVAMADPARQRELIAEIEADPYAAGQKFYEMQKALYAPEQEQDRLRLEERLLGQGMLGSTGGALQTEALRKAQAQVDLEAQYKGLEQAQSLIDTYRARSEGSLGLAETIGQLPQKYAETGRGIGTELGSIGASTAATTSAAAQARAASMSNIYGGLTEQFTGLFNQPVQTSTANTSNLTSPISTYESWLNMQK